jgi:hypothetical protein
MLSYKLSIIYVIVEYWFASLIILCTIVILKTLFYEQNII